MSIKTFLLNALNQRVLGGAVHRLLGPLLRGRPRILGLTNPLYVPHFVVERDGARYIASFESYLAQRSPSRQRVQFDGGAYEPEVSYLISALLGPTDVAIDVGANVGLHTVAMAKHAHRGHVYAFEPVAEMAEQNSLNCAFNGLSNVTIVRCGLGASSDEMDMKVRTAGAGLEGTSSFMDTAHVTAHPEDFEVRRLSVRRLDDVLAKLNPAGRIALIKIDTEGFEVPVIEGAKATIDAHHPALIVEAHSTRLQKMGKDFSWYLKTFPNHHVLIIEPATPANPYLRLTPLRDEPAEICVNLLLLPRTTAIVP
jgi:FkbM family methyltransferase